MDNLELKMSKPKYMREIQKLVEGMGLNYIKEGDYNSAGHPIHFIEFMFDGVPTIKEVPSSGTPRNPRRDLQNFKRRLKNIQRHKGKFAASGATIRLSEEIEQSNWFHILKVG